MSSGSPKKSAKKAHKKARVKDPFWFAKTLLVRDLVRDLGRTQDKLRGDLLAFNQGQKPRYRIDDYHFRRVIQGRERRPLHWSEFLGDIAKILTSYHPESEQPQMQERYDSLLRRTDQVRSITDETYANPNPTAVAVTRVERHNAIDKTIKRSIFVPCWGTTNPAFNDPGGDFYTGLPPLRVSSKGNLDIDVTVLLVADELVFDKASIDAILHRKDPLLVRLQETLRALSGEGFITLEDINGVIRGREHEFRSDLRYELQRVDNWLPLVRNSIERWDEIVKKQKSAAPADKLNLVSLQPGAVTNAIVATNQKFVSEDVERVRQALFSDKPRLEKWEIRARAAAVEAWIGPTISNLMIGQATGSPPLDWETMDEFYKTKTYGVEDQVKKQIAKLHELFSLALPQLAPSTTKKLISILKDERSNDLRRLVANAAQDGSLLNQEFGGKALVAMGRLSRHADVGTFEANTKFRTTIGVGSDFAWLFCLMDHR